MVYECELRDYHKANECYLKVTPKLATQHKEFVQRMEKRYQRDVKLVLGHSPLKPESKKRESSPSDSITADTKLMNKYVEGLKAVKESGKPVKEPQP